MPARVALWIAQVHRQSAIAVLVWGSSRCRYAEEVCNAPVSFRQAHVENGNAFAGGDLPISVRREQGVDYDFKTAVGMVSEDSTRRGLRATRFRIARRRVW